MNSSLPQGDEPPTPLQGAAEPAPVPPGIPAFPFAHDPATANAPDATTVIGLLGVDTPHFTGGEETPSSFHVRGVYRPPGC